MPTQVVRESTGTAPRKIRDQTEGCMSAQVTGSSSVPTAASALRSVPIIFTPAHRRYRRTMPGTAGRSGICGAQETAATLCPAGKVIFCSTSRIGPWRMVCALCRRKSGIGPPELAVRPDRCIGTRLPETPYPSAAPTDRASLTGWHSTAVAMNSCSPVRVRLLPRMGRCEGHWVGSIAIGPIPAAKAGRTRSRFLMPAAFY